MPKAKQTQPEEEAPGIGHNALSPAALRGYVERIERLVEDRKAVNEDIRQVLAEADINGFDKKTVKEMVKIRAMDPDDRKEQFELRDAYLEALGLL